MTTVTSVILAIFNGLAAIPKIAEYVKTLAAEIALWYITQQNNETYTKIIDAAAAAARAKTDVERYAAAQKWREALSRPRFDK